MNPDNTTPQRDDEALADAMVSLVEKIDRWTLAKGNEPSTAYPALSIYRHEGPTELISYIKESSICLIAQGRKRVLLGEDEYFYDQDHYLIASVNLPVVVQILEASRQKTYLGLTLKLEKKLIAQILVDDDLSIRRTQPAGRGLAVSKITLPMVQAFQRLIDLLDHLDDVPALAPLIQREILYRLLTSEQGQRLRQISMIGSHSHQIARVIDWLKENYDKASRSMIWHLTAG